MQDFPKQARLRNRSQFLELSRTAQRVYTPHFLLLWRDNSLGRSRIGVTVTRKVAGAVGRNRVKRMVREAFRRSSLARSLELDLVIIARQGAPALNGNQTAQQLEEAFQRIRRKANPSG